MGRWTSRQWCTRQRGQALSEYGLILALAVLVVIFGLALVGPAIAHVLSNIEPAL